MSSKWQVNKIGLINFWYYDEQEFVFTKGRMLLRGSNGSGKSVTMQSVIPLLLDGNMSPERLDPFGSRDRKMNSYLLEEGDEREERTGYLYLECKRVSSNTYITIGMGMRARKGKQLDKWYFGLSDGRRIGEDFLLYKDAGEKITLSKKELSNRIGMGGQVFDRQVEYMEYVNRQIFGFETVEEYKEMIDLLIQLRTPKLSKDFKPTVINEILSNSLQPLSDDELRPMSEAIENMDAMNLNLKARQEGIVAAEKINKVLTRYNRLLLWEKSTFYAENIAQIEQTQQFLKDLERKEKTCKEAIISLEEEEVNLNAKKVAFEQERELFQKSDVWNLKKQEVDLQNEIKDKTITLQKKEEQLENKKEARIELEYKVKEETDRKELKEKEIEDTLEEMQEYADEMFFQEHAFMMAELKENFDIEYSFATHDIQLETLKSQVKLGSKHLKECEYLQKQIEDCLKKRDDSQREVDKTERKLNELQGTLITTQSDWKESLYQWNDHNQELILPKEMLQTMCSMVDTYHLQTDYRTFRVLPESIYDTRKSELELHLQQQKNLVVEQKKELAELQSELEEWKKFKEPVPKRSEEVIRNREQLQQLGISYQELYKVLEFAPSLKEEQCNRLEEALLRMGILDAILVDVDDRERILAMEEGNCDHYLFMQKGMGKNSLLDVLDLNDTVHDMFLNQKVVSILSNIGFGVSEEYLDTDNDSCTKIDKNGFYQLGILTGTITGTYEAGFLGSKARETNRLRKIAECEEKILMVQAEIEHINQEIGIYEARKALIIREYNEFPNDDTLRTVWSEIDEIERAQKQYKSEVETYELQLQEVGKQKNEIYRLAVDLAQKLYITCNLEVFEQVEESANDYEKLYYELKSLHTHYLQTMKYMEHLVEQVNQIEDDVDTILGEIRNVKSALKKTQELYESVCEQLKSEGFEEKQTRMEECLNWLEEYPRVLTKCIQHKSDEENLQKQLQETKETNEIRGEELQRKNIYLQTAYEKELQLGYVILPEEIEKTPKEIGEYLGIDCKTMSKNKESQNLNIVIFENQNYLLDYQLMKLDLFLELDEDKKDGYPESNRMDITARYQGVKVNFVQLLHHLEEEIGELKVLIRDGDRELFEDILANTISRKLRSKINSSNAWVEKMNGLMSSMNTSSGLKLNLKWRYKTAENEQQLDTKELVEYLKKDYRLMREEEAERLSRHFRSKVEEARRNAKDSGGSVSFYQVMKETLDYRKWFEFQLFSQKSGERMKELTNSVFGTFSGGEKAMAMYVPLFSAVVAKYQGGSKDAPRMISLDEAFAGVDNKNIKDMFRLMTEFEFEFVINSQVLWGDVDTLDALSIYQLMRPTNAKFVTVMPYIWNGHKKEMLEDESRMQERAASFT